MAFLFFLLAFALVLVVASVWAALGDRRGPIPPPSHFVDPRFRAPSAW